MTVGSRWIAQSIRVCSTAGLLLYRIITIPARFRLRKARQKALERADWNLSRQ